MGLFSLYGVGTGHARLGRSKNSIFSATVWWLAADEGGERTSNFSKPVALRGPRIAFGLKFPTPSGVCAARRAQWGGVSAPPVT